jgi:hypothetical protein
MPAPIDIAAVAWHYYQGASAQSEAATKRARTSEHLNALSLDIVPDQGPPRRGYAPEPPIPGTTLPGIPDLQYPEPP